MNRAEFLINDRLSFMRFLGLGLEDRVPDARTIWLFREKLTTIGAIKKLFKQRCDAEGAGYIAMSAQIGIRPSLIAFFSSSVLRWRGAAIRLASAIENSSGRSRLVSPRLMLRPNLMTARKGLFWN